MKTSTIIGPLLFVVVYFFWEIMKSAYSLFSEFTSLRNGILAAVFGVPDYVIMIGLALIGVIRYIAKKLFD
ncbi:MAG: hypothetical protein J6T25_00820 [Bacilli bacterium]|nr:hypothetical protein [Bacilli bacterium]